MKKITLHIADASYLSRLGLQHLFARSRDVEIIAESGTADELREQFQNKVPDVLLIDYQSSNEFSLDDIAWVHQYAPETKIIIVSLDETKDNIHKALEFGVNCYLTRQCDKDEIKNALKATAKGEKFFCNKILNILLEKNPDQESEDDCLPTELSVREQEVVKLVGLGYSSKDIANKLNLSPHTINTHRKNVLRKLGLKSTSELILYAVNTGLLPVNT